MSRCAVALFVIVSILQLVCSSLKKDGVLRRSLQVGDIFTPQDLIKVAKKLRSKVENPGEGKGIVSSSKNAEMLADRIFSAFFFTKNRFIPIREPDIPGLDALQALALSGDDFKPEIHFVKDLDPHSARKSKSDSRRCRYALITRKSYVYDDGTETTRRAIPEAKYLMKKRRIQVKTGRRNRNKTKRQKGKVNDSSSPDARRGKVNKRKSYEYYDDSETTRRAIPEAKYLMKKRRIQVKTGRRSGNETNSTVYSGHVTRPMQKVNKSHVVSFTPRTMNYTIVDYAKSIKTDNKDNCIWKYMCKFPADMETCQLYPECPAKDSNHTYDDIPIEHSEDEHEDNIKLVRKMLGIYIIDEEVEKIFERRHFLFSPSSKLNDDKHKDVESLKYYFDNVISGQLSRTTTKMYNTQNQENVKRKKSKARKSMFWSLKQGHHKPFRPQVKEKDVVVDTGYNFPSSIPTTTPFHM